jgi:ABC-2 type transport system permease protein
MKFITVTLKGVKVMRLNIFKPILRFERLDKKNHNRSVFSAIVQKEFADNIRSWRIMILLAIILLTCIGSLYTAVTSIQDVIDQLSKESQQIGQDLYLFLQLFTVSDGTLPSFITFVAFLSPLLGIALGFDAINMERNKGTLSRIMAQPIPRDFVITGKFFASLLLCTILFLSLGLLVTALGILILGIPPTFEEFLRILFFLFICIVYIAFWLNLGILFSAIFKQAATSALSSIAIWLFFSTFYSMIINLLSKSYLTPHSFTTVEDAMNRSEFILNLLRLSPNYLFNESITTLLSPTVRSLGPLTVEQTVGAVASPLPLSQSLLLIWPQITGLIAATLICFALAYIIFIRQEIRAH